MPQPLFAAFFPSYAFLQDSCCDVAANFSSVLEAVRSLRRAVNTNRNSIDLRIDDTLRERMTGKSNKAQLQAIDNRLFSLAIDGHPNVTGIRRENAVPGECRLKAHNAAGYSLAGEGDLMFEVRGKISTGVQPAADLDEQSLTCGFAQVVGMHTERIQLSRTRCAPDPANRRRGVDSHDLSRCTSCFSGGECSDRSRRAGRSIGLLSADSSVFRNLVTEVRLVEQDRERRNR
jgi:hypothetical protein